MIAALFVEEGGSYYGIEDVDPWPESRNAMYYWGPNPVVAHPPCARWCKLAKVVEAKYGHRVGDDGGTFAHALACVRRFGGVLEHPAFSLAWSAHNLNPPPTKGGWVNADFVGGWTCYVEQGRYGLPVHKPTYLYAVGCELPTLPWGYSCGPSEAQWGSTSHTRPHFPKSQRSKTPPQFRDLLLMLARSTQTATPPQSESPSVDSGCPDTKRSNRDS